MVLQEDIQTIIADQNIPWKVLQQAKVLVTGATGLIGSLCIRALQALPFPVQIYALVRDQERAAAMLGDEVRYIIGDIRTSVTDLEELDYVIHCASVTKSKQMVDTPADTLEIAIDGTRNILQLAQKCHAKGVVYVSSMEVYGVTELAQNPVTEEKLGYVDLTAARSSYSEGKRAAECLCSAYYHQYGLPVKVARLALTMGAGIPLSDNRVAMQFAKSAVHGEDIVLHTAGKSNSNFVYTSDCIRGIFTILLSGEAGQAYNVCNEAETRSIGEIAAMVADRIAGGKISVVYDIQEGNTFGYAPDVVLRLSAGKLKALGWTPHISLEDAYRRLIRYIQGE